MNRKIRRMMSEIERRGGKLYVNPQLPDEMAEEFLAEVLACPDCGSTAGLEAFGSGGDALDVPELPSVADRNDRRGH